MARMSSTAIFFIVEQPLLPLLFVGINAHQVVVAVALFEVHRLKRIFNGVDHRQRANVYFLVGGLSLSARQFRLFGHIRPQDLDRMVQVPGNRHIGILFQFVILTIRVFVQRFIADAQIIAQKLHGHCLFFVKTRDSLLIFSQNFLVCSGKKW